MLAASTLAIFHHGTMDVGNNGVGVRNDGMCVCNTLMNIGSDGLGVHNTLEDV